VQNGFFSVTSTTGAVPLTLARMVLHKRRLLLVRCLFPGPGGHGNLPAAYSAGRFMRHPSGGE
jgi:hypothetical protein